MLVIHLNKMKQTEMVYNFFSVKYITNTPSLFIWALK